MRFKGFGQQVGQFGWMESPDTGAGGGTGSSGGGGSGGAGGEGGAPGGNAEGGAGNPQPLVYEDWLKGQPEEVKGLLDGHTKGLRSALQSEREARGTAEKALREAAAKLEKGSAAEKQLVELADGMAEADRRAEFYDEAHRMNVTDLKLAYLAAVADDLFDKRGRVDFETLKKSHPTLFGVSRPPEGNAGKGTGGTQPGSASMNDFIRKAAGRQ